MDDGQGVWASEVPGHTATIDHRSSSRKSCAEMFAKASAYFIRSAIESASSRSVHLFPTDTLVRLAHQGTKAQSYGHTYGCVIMTCWIEFQVLQSSIIYFDRFCWGCLLTCFLTKFRLFYLLIADSVEPYLYTWQSLLCVCQTTKATDIDVFGLPM